MARKDVSGIEDSFLPKETLSDRPASFRLILLLDSILLASCRFPIYKLFVLPEGLGDRLAMSYKLAVSPSRRSSRSPLLMTN